MLAGITTAAAVAAALAVSAGPAQAAKPATGPIKCGTHRVVYSAPYLRWSIHWRYSHIRRMDAKRHVHHRYRSRATRRITRTTHDRCYLAWQKRVAIRRYHAAAARLRAYRLAHSGSPVDIGRAMAAARGWTGYNWTALYLLWNRESGWNPNALNASSGACGIPQALPCSKISDHSTRGQIAWGLGYISGRYGTPAAAWAHSEAFGWY